MNSSLSPFAPENLVSRDGFGRPVPRQSVPFVLLLLFLTFSALVANPKKTTLHGRQSRSWSAEQGKKEKIWQRLSPPPPPPPPPARAAQSEKINLKKKITRRIHIYRRYASRRYAGGLGPSRILTRIPTTHQPGQWCRFAKLYASVCDCNFPSLVASLFSWRCLAPSSSSFPHAAMNLRPPSVAASTQTSAFTAIVSQSPVMPNARMSLCTQSVHSFSSHPVLYALRPQGFRT